jgi:hypothetical protein
LSGPIPIRKPEDLKDVPISVGMRAGSHFNVPIARTLSAVRAY